MFNKVLVCLAVVFVSSCSMNDDAGALREARDRADIENLMWRYVRALDTLDEEAYAAVFTEDGEFISSQLGSGEKGHEALKEVILGIKRGRAERDTPSPAMHHMIVNHYLEFEDADHINYHSYWMTVFAGSGADVPVNVAAVGRGIDKLVRVDGEWLIKSRNVSPQD